MFVCKCDISVIPQDSGCITEEMAEILNELEDGKGSCDMLSSRGNVTMAPMSSQQLNKVKPVKLLAQMGGGLRSPAPS